VSSYRPAPAWNPSPEARSQVEKVIDEQLKDELAHEETRRAWMEPRKQFEELQGQGKVKLTYDAQAFQLSPDGYLLLFVRARWMVDQKLAMLISLWLHLGPTVTSELVEEDGARGLWLAASPGQSSIPAEAIAFDRLGTVVNAFNRGDGYGELLLYFQGEESFRFTVFRYTPAGLRETKISISDGC
jgi:hypothetical protein